MNRHGALGESLSPQAILTIVSQYGRELGVKLQAHDARRTCAKLCRAKGGDLEQIQLLLGHASIQTTEKYLGSKLNLVDAVNDGLGLLGDEGNDSEEQGREGAKHVSQRRKKEEPHDR